MSEIVARLGHGVASFDPADWDRCAGHGRSVPQPCLPLRARGIGQRDAGAPAGRAVPIAIDGEDGRPAALMPAYVKSHSQGEYVFDHGWAAAWERAGGDYYPKLQIAVPFTPVPGRRLLTGRDGSRPRPDRRGRGGGEPARPLLGPRDLHRRGGSGAVRARGLADPGRQPVPLAQSRLWRLRGFPRRRCRRASARRSAASGRRRWPG